MTVNPHEATTPGDVRGSVYTHSGLGQPAASTIVSARRAKTTSEITAPRMNWSTSARVTRPVATRDSNRGRRMATLSSMMASRTSQKCRRSICTERVCWRGGLARAFRGRFAHRAPRRTVDALCRRPRAPVSAVSYLRRNASTRARSGRKSAEHRTALLRRRQPRCSRGQVKKMNVLEPASSAEQTKYSFAHPKAARKA